MAWLAAWRTHRQNLRAHPRMLFTFPGVLMMVVSVGMGFDTFGEPSTIKRLLVSFLFGALVVDVAWLIRQVRRVRVAEAWAERSRAQEVAQIRVVVHNDSASDALMRVTLDARGQPPVWGWVLRQQQHTFAVQSGQVLQRGEHAFPDLLCELHSPLRLFCAKWVPKPDAEEDPREEVRVWPAPWPDSLPTMPTVPYPERTDDQPTPSASAEWTEEGVRAQSAPGSHGWLREWRRGDRLAHIAHKASAHRDQMLVQTASSRLKDDQPDVLLSLAWALAITEGQREPALSLLGSMAEKAIAEGRRVSLLLEHTSVALGQGEHHRRTLLDALARVARTP